MSTIEEFENAPVGATAISPEGKIAVKTGRRDLEWSVYDPCGWYRDNYRSAEMVRYTLNPVAPTNSREALDLAWNLAHEVKEGQVIPEGTQYLEFHGYELQEVSAWDDLEIIPELVAVVRTHEPLPDPLPDWLDAPAVLAHTDNDDTRRVWTARRDGQWASTSHTYTRHWRELRDVTPLYPREGDNA